MDARSRVCSDQIRVGEPIQFDCYDGTNRLLLKRGFIITSQHQVDYLLERGLYASTTQQQSIPAANTKRRTTPFQALDEFRIRFNRLLNELHAVGSGASPAAIPAMVEPLARLASELQELCTVDSDALLGLVHLELPMRYTVSHPLHRAIVCELIAKRVGLIPAVRTRLLCAALTCDLAMFEMQEQLTRQAQPLQQEQRQAIHRHPLESARMLSALGVTDDQWLLAVLQHHEFVNGNGYPRGLQHPELSDFSQILTMADVYCAMVSARADRKPHLSKVAMRSMLAKRGVAFDGELPVLLVKEFGVYPPGAFVRLQNGEVAIVIRRTSTSKAPQVKSVVGPRGAPFRQPIVRDTATADYEINDVVERDPIVVIDFDRLWDYPAA